MPLFDHITTLPALHAADRRVILQSRLAELRTDNLTPNAEEEAVVGTGAGAEALSYVRRAAAVCSSYQAGDLVRVADLAARLSSLAAYRSAGASGFGIGSALFKPGMAVAEVHQQALRFRQAWTDL